MITKIIITITGLYISTTIFLIPFCGCSKSLIRKTIVLGKHFIDNQTFELISLITWIVRFSVRQEDKNLQMSNTLLMMFNRQKYESTIQSLYFALLNKSAMRIVFNINWKDSGLGFKYHIVCHRFRFTKRDDFFVSILTTFKLRGCWGSIVNWLKPKIEPP